MPKGKGKGGRRGGETKAERARQRALARELSAISANRATSTWTGPKLVSKSTQVVLQPEPPRRPRVLLII
jgi:hypothetical protein